MVVISDDDSSPHFSEVTMDICEGLLFLLFTLPRAGDGARGKKGVICEGLLYHLLVRGFRRFWCSSVHTVVQTERLDLSALL